MKIFARVNSNKGMISLAVFQHRNISDRLENRKSESLVFHPWKPSKFISSARLHEIHPAANHKYGNYYGNMDEQVSKIFNEKASVSV